MSNYDIPDQPKEAPEPSRVHIRPSLGEQEYAIIETALLFFADTFTDDEEMEDHPEFAEITERARRVRRRLIKIRRRAGLVWQNEDISDPDAVSEITPAMVH